MAARRPYVLIVAPLVLAACGGGGASTPKNGGGLSAAVQKTLAQGSEKVGLAGKVGLSGQTFTVKGNGAFGRKGGTLHLSVKVPIVGTTTLDEIVVGKRAWLRSPLVGKGWVPVENGPKALGFDTRALTGVTPASALELLRTGKVEALSDHHYRVTLTRKSGGVQFNTAEAWVDDQNLIWRVNVDFDATVSGSKAHSVMTIDYSDFGTPVSVSPPPAAEVGG